MIFLIDSYIIFYYLLIRIEINNECLRRYGDQNTPQIDLFSVDSIIQENTEEEFVPLEVVHNLNPSGMPPHQLSLKIGCIVMLLRNIDIDSGIVNGRRMKVKQIGNNNLKNNYYSSKS